MMPERRPGELCVVGIDRVRCILLESHSYQWILSSFIIFRLNFVLIRFGFIHLLVLFESDFFNLHSHGRFYCDQEKKKQKRCSNSVSVSCITFSIVEGPFVSLLL